MNYLHDLIFTYLLYDPQRPLLFTQVFFWVFFLVVLLGYTLVYKHPPWRNAYLFVVSMYFYYKCGGAFIWLLLFSIIITYLIGIGLSKARRAWLRRGYVILSVSVSVVLLLYYKYAYFIAGQFNNLFHTKFVVHDYLAFWANLRIGTHFEVSTIILPVGISFFSFQALSYTIDLYRGKTRAVTNIFDFGFYKSFFPQLVAGPIVRAAGFIPQMYTEYALTNREMGHAVFLILNGLLKKMVISDYISINFVDRVFDNPLGYSGFENLMAVYGYSLQIYCDFSGYTDIAIGLALLLGFRIPINFNSPYKAASLTDFWRRWHISLSSWLRDYLYIPLGGNRKGKFRMYTNLLATMLLGGLWHGANLRFMVWGGIHGLGLVIEKLFRKNINLPPVKQWFRSFLAVFITFHLVSFAWIFFRAANMQATGNMLMQIGTHFGFQSVPSMLLGYSNVFLLMLLAYSIHWLPGSFKEQYRGWFITTPIYVKLVICVVVVLIIFQFKTAVLQPFIYFQF
jgi:alginate O-acetyltransferase complex protein AlgI